MRLATRTPCAPLAALAAGALCLFAAACTGVVSTTGRVPDAETAASLLQRGRATKLDVERLLGTPQGRGEALLPGQTGPSREVWFYESLRIEPPVQSLAGSSGRAQTRVVLVFFDGERLDGLVWWPVDERIVVR